MASLADQAVKDDVFSKYEREELKAMMNLLGIDERKAIKFFKAAQVSRYTALSEGLPPLPEWCRWGEPLRVGDRVVFIGMDDALREQSEILARARAIYIGSTPAKNTAMLVIDGSFRGCKYNKAVELGMCMVSPEEFKQMLKWVQPFQA